MTITLYTNKSEENKLDKNLTTLGTFTGTLREGTSMLSPTITFTGLTENQYSKANYMYIKEFGRYYFITGIDSAFNNVWAFKCEVDELYTYRDQIRNQYALVGRQENLSNQYLIDNRLIHEARTDFKPFAFNESFTSYPTPILVAAKGAIPESYNIDPTNCYCWINTTFQHVTSAAPGETVYVVPIVPEGKEFIGWSGNVTITEETTFVNAHFTMPVYDVNIEAILINKE